MEYGIWGFHAAGGLWGDPRFSRRRPMIPPGVTPQIFSRATLALNSIYHHNQMGRNVDPDDVPYEAIELTAKSSLTTDDLGNDSRAPLERNKISQDIETNSERNEEDEDDNQNHTSHGADDNEDLGDESDSMSSSSSHHSSGNNNPLIDKLDPMGCFGFDKDETVNPMLNGWVLGAYTAMLGRLSAATAALEATEIPSVPSDSDSEMSDQSSCNEKSRDSSPVLNAYRGYSCGSCETVAATRPALKKHIVDCHSASSANSATGEIGDARRCPSLGCDFTSASRCEMESHVAAHVAQDMVPSAKKRTLALQRVRYEREEYRCSLCTYACTIEKAFQRHLRAHARGTAPETRVSCAVCGADRSSEVDLSRHMRRHRDDRYFCCDICVFRTVQLKKLIQHRRMHTGEKPHLCPHCAYRSARRDNLRSHVRRVHKKENLYCDTFSPRGMLMTPTATDIESVSNLMNIPAISSTSDENVVD